MLRVAAIVLGLCVTASGQDPVWQISPINGHWYALTLSNGSWTDAQAQAQAWGGNLATIRTPSENDWLLGFGSGSSPTNKLWMGLWQDTADPSYSEPSGGWKWIDGDPSTWTNWNSNEPNDQSNTEHFGEFTFQTPGKWNDIFLAGTAPGQPGIVELVSDDCNANALPDLYEIAVGLVGDMNGDGVPDECDVWNDVGPALPGSAGDPALVGDGSLLPNDLVTLSLTNAKPFASATLVVGFSAVNAPFKGGVLVPAINIVFGQTTDFFGGTTFGGLWPTGVPSGFVTYFQYWIADDAGPVGFAASNGLAGTAP